MSVSLTWNLCGVAASIASDRGSEYEERIAPESCTSRIHAWCFFLSKQPFCTVSASCAQLLSRGEDSGMVRVRENFCDSSREKGVGVVRGASRLDSAGRARYRKGEVGRRVLARAPLRLAKVVPLFVLHSRALTTPSVAAHTVFIKHDNYASQQQD